MRRPGKYLLAIPLGLLLLVAGTLSILTVSESGSRWLVRQALVYAPGELQISHISGRLLSGLTLSGLSYQLDQTDIEIGQLTLGWRAADLVGGTVRVRQAIARDVVYREPAAPANAEAFALPERISLPMAVRLDKALITNLRIELGEEHTVIEELGLSARAGPIHGLSIRQLDLRMADTTLQLSGKASLHQPYAFRCTLQWRHSRLPDVTEASGTAKLHGDLRLVNVDHTLSMPFPVTSKGTVRLDDAVPVFALSGQWQALRWPITGVASYTSPQGEYTIEGTTDAYSLSLKGPLDIEDAPHLDVQARAHGNLAGLSVEELHLVTLGGNLSARGNMTWSPEFSAALDIDGKQINPGHSWPEWPGQLAIRTHLDVATQNDSVKVEFRKLDLQGTLRENPVSAQGDLSFDDGVPESSGLHINSGENHAEVSGILNTRSGLHYRIDAPQLSAVLPGLAGEVHANGTLKGTLEQVSGNIDLTASALSYQENSLQTLNIKAQLNPGKIQTANIRIDAQGALLGQTPINTLTLTSEGRIDNHQASLDMASPQGKLTLRLQGGYHTAAWDGHVNIASLNLQQLGDWQLREPVALHLTAHSARPFHACWQMQQRSICLRGNWDNDTLQLAVTGEASEGHLQGDITLSQLASKHPPLKGTVTADIPDIRFLNPLLTDISIASGTASARIRLAGKLDAPVIRGTAALTDTVADIPELGITVRNINLQAQSEATDLVVSGSANSGEGNIRLAGRLSLDPEHAWPYDFKIQGERFILTKLPEMDIQVNPDLQLAGSLQQASITGSLLIPSARITLKELPPDVVKVSADQVIVGPAAPPATQASAALPVNVNVTASLGDDVYFEGLGLSTRLVGGINVRNLQSSTLVGNGVLELRDGRYQGYGQKLLIQHGRLLFAGPLDNPSLDIQATRTIGDIVAGLELTGNADAPQSRLFSNPAMSDTEVLSYLVTGKPLSAASTGNDSQALAAAAISLGANNPVADEIRQTLGIEFGVQSGATDEDTAATVGKQLSPRLHVDYIYGLFNETAAFQVIYKLTRHLSLTGLSGAQQSIDLNFSIDRK